MKSIARFLIIAGLVMAVGSAPAAADHDKGPNCTDILSTTDGSYVVVNGRAVVTVLLETQGICEQVTYTVTVTDASGAVLGTQDDSTATSCGSSCLQFSIDVGAVAAARRTITVTMTTSIGKHIFDTVTGPLTLCEPLGDLYPDIPECAPPGGWGLDE